MILESERLHTKRDASWLFCGDCRSMYELPDESVQCVVTSPPYWGLRKYSGEQSLIWEDGWKGSYGREPTPEMYIQHTIEILKEIKRVLRKDGVVWWNIGDTYIGGGRGAHEKFGDGRKGDNLLESFKGDDTLKTKDLCLIPFRLAIAAQEDGWWVRSIVIWHKPNAMPESNNGWRWEKHRIKTKSLRVIRPHSHEEGVGDGRRGTDRGYTRPNGGGDPSLSTSPSAEWQDCSGCPKCSPNDGYILRRGSWRPTEDYEFILMLTKSADYYCDKNAVIEPYMQPLNRWGGHKTKPTDQFKGDEFSIQERISREHRPNERGRNLRTVWTFPTQSMSIKHFAAFPQKLPEICIKASTPEVGCCSKCGAPWARIVIQNRWATRPGNPIKVGESRNDGGRADRIMTATQTIGWKPTCKCDADRIPSIVLDPLVGTGTTLLVAEELGRLSVGYDLSKEYCNIATKRLEEERKAPRRRRGAKKSKRELTPEDKQAIVTRLRAGKERKRLEREAQDRSPSYEELTEEKVIILKPRRRPA